MRETAKSKATSTNQDGFLHWVIIFSIILAGIGALTVWRIWGQDSEIAVTSTSNELKGTDSVETASLNTEPAPTIYSSELIPSLNNIELPAGWTVSESTTPASADQYGDVAENLVNIDVVFKKLDSKLTVSAFPTVFTGGGLYCFVADYELIHTVNRENLNYDVSYYRATVTTSAEDNSYPRLGTRYRSGAPIEEYNLPVGHPDRVDGQNFCSSDPFLGNLASTFEEVRSTHGTGAMLYAVDFLEFEGTTADHEDSDTIASQILKIIANQLD